MTWQEKKYYVLFVNGYRTGQVAQIAWVKAHALELTGEASFISNTLYKAAKVGIDITKLTKAEIEKLPNRIKESKEKQRKSKEKTTKKKHSKEDVKVNANA